MSTLAILSLVVGGELAAWIIRMRERRAALTVPAPQSGRVAPPLDPRIVTLYLLIGLGLYAGLARIAGEVPSATAIVSAGSTLMVVAAALKAWNAWALGRRSRVWLWLAASAAFPLVTVVAQGFLGYGLAAMLSVFAFVATFYRPRWTVVVAGVVLAYVGLSVYVTYMRDRRDIRAVVWSGAALDERASRLLETFATAEWFHPENTAHLDRVDDRLNQDYLLGAAILRVRAGLVPLAGGETFKDAALALIPRALWPQKPVVAGSGNLVATYAGMRFNSGVSVGIGQAMECYVNFGTAGVIVGFVLIGMLLVAIDRAAFQRLKAGDLGAFTLWFLPGLSLLQIGGSFVEVTSTAAAAWLVAWVMKHLALMMPPASGRRPIPYRPAVPDAPPWP